MMSRIRLYLENTEDTEDARVGAFFAVRGEFGVFYVTPTMAERIERALDRSEAPSRSPARGEGRSAGVGG